MIIHGVKINLGWQCGNWNYYGIMYCVYLLINLAAGAYPWLLSSLIDSSH